MKKNLFFSILLLILSNSVFSQTATSSVEMADKFRADGKIYVVVVVATIIMTLILVYLFRLDKKIQKIENQK